MCLRPSRRVSRIFTTDEGSAHLVHVELVDRKEGDSERQFVVVPNLTLGHPRYVRSGGVGDVGGHTSMV